uniref:Uncharacterized protein n=1 Tax=Chromera velia CCMP2878 TaxID=1169474 RepID=A0A0G4FUM5_9ALVE|eukprot:Cvel_3749.t1-p1 / transcript=Cvel_3749.t1 / gene=Cvel_3749 / organism=Chromera_velia_CCMP2878 / gene_product=hypothetical protein / transcript_product=hypothetical protein / location=Cvel_scaffold156:103516-104334(+) / protein_length=110 / sequence_SO=supercontig / SO=protein_coding / is_pseudo=false
MAHEGQCRQVASFSSPGVSSAGPDRPRRLEETASEFRVAGLEEGVSDAFRLPQTSDQETAEAGFVRPEKQTATQVLEKISLPPSIASSEMEAETEKDTIMSRHLRGRTST